MLILLLIISMWSAALRLTWVNVGLWHCMVQRPAQPSVCASAWTCSKVLMAGGDRSTALVSSTKLSRASSQQTKRRRIATEKLVKRAYWSVKEELESQGKKLHMLKAEGMVCVGWKPLLRLTPYPDGSYDCHFNPKMVQATGVEKQVILDALEGASRGGFGISDDIEWEL